MDKDLAEESHAAASESIKINSTPGASDNREMMPKPEIILELLKRLDSDISCSSEKLLNLDLCISDMSLGENDPGVFSMEKGSLSDEQSEKTLALDLSLSYLGSEVIELGNFLDSLQVEVVNVYEKINLFESEPELAMLFEESLRKLEAFLKPLQQKLQEMKKQLGILQRIRSFGQNSSYTFPEEKDTSVSSELEHDKKFAEFKQNEDELTWLRLLEAENLAEVFKGIGSQMISHLRVLQFNLNTSHKREAELKFQIQAFHEKLQEAKNEETNTYLCQVNALKENVKLLEKKLEASDQTLFEMEQLIISMRENAFAAESRAEAAEAKAAELTETNMELTEELGFLKGAESKTEKVTLLEKQVRDLEKQLQNAKVSSEASLEQQNMLYEAIWDMETLIEDLKSKASKAEVRSEATEDKCLKLAESNSELNKEIRCLKSRAENLETSLKDISRRKSASAKDINSGAKVIADMVMQLAIERERIQKQLHSLTRENMILMEELRKSRKKVFDTANGMKEDNDGVKEACSVNGLSFSETESVGLPETSFTSNQVNESLDVATSNENEEGFSASPDNTSDPSRHETANAKKHGHWKVSRRYILMGIFMLVLSAGAMLLICTEKKFATLQQHLGI